MAKLQDANLDIKTDKINSIKWIFHETWWMAKRFCEKQSINIQREFNSCLRDFKYFYNIDQFEDDEILIPIEEIDTENSRNVIISNPIFCELLIPKQNIFAKIDHADVPLIKNLRWCLDANGYVSGTISKNERIKLHNNLLGVTPIDHINRDKLDNRRRNLRVTDTSLNNKNTTTKGYSWSESRKKWIVTIKLNFKNIFIGRFKEEEDAKKASFNARMFYFGEYSPDYYLIKSLKFILFNARRYAHGRSTYAPEAYNEAIRLAQNLGLKFEPDHDGLIEAKDGMFDKDWFESRQINSIKFITDEENKNGK